jgi:hypothetical protein
MPGSAPETISSIIDPQLRRPFSLIIGIVVVITAVIFGLSKAEGFVDGRIELKMASARERSDEQAARLAKMEEQFSMMRDTLAEIRADVRVLRAGIEGRRPLPAASAAPSGE